MVAGHCQDAIERLLVEVVGGLPFVNSIPFLTKLIWDELDEGAVEAANQLENVALLIDVEAVVDGVVFGEAEGFESVVEIVEAVEVGEGGGKPLPYGRIRDRRSRDTRR